VLIDAYGSLPHYCAHIAPVWDQLPDQLRGEWLDPRRLHRRDPSRTVLVASWRDAQQVAPSPLVYLEHGAGQSYDGDPRGVGNGSYSGGAGLERVVLFLCPSDRVADRWRAVYPSAGVAVVGCPKLDRWHGLARQVRDGGEQDGGVVTGEAQEQVAPSAQEPPVLAGGVAVVQQQPLGGRGLAADRAPSVLLGDHLGEAPLGQPVAQQQHLVAAGVGGGVDHGRDGTAAPTVAVTFHWECGLVPETRSAWSHYDRVLPHLAADPRWQLLGHGHPRLWGTIRRRWAQLGVEHTPELDDVLDRADLLVGDNTSALFEFASTGRPVVVVNAPWYRRDVEHGLRFWSHPPGLQVDRPEQLADTIARALADPPAARRIRAAAVAETYAATDGRAAHRAAEAIKELDHA